MLSIIIEMLTTLFERFDDWFYDQCTECGGRRGDRLPRPRRPAGYFPQNKPEELPPVNNVETSGRLSTTKKVPTFFEQNNTSAAEMFDQGAVGKRAAESIPELSAQDPNNKLMPQMTEKEFDERVNKIVSKKLEEKAEDDKNTAQAEKIESLLTFSLFGKVVVGCLIGEGMLNGDTTAIDEFQSRVDEAKELLPNSNVTEALNNELDQKPK